MHKDICKKYLNCFLVNEDNKKFYIKLHKEADTELLIFMRKLHKRYRCENRNEWLYNAVYDSLLLYSKKYNEDEFIDTKIEDFSLDYLREWMVNPYSFFLINHTLEDEYEGCEEVIKIEKVVQETVKDTLSNIRFHVGTFINQYI